MSAVVQENLHIRPMLLTDLSCVLAIEQEAHISPWTTGIFQDCLRVDYQCDVLEHHAIIKAYGIMSVAVQEAHILNLCVCNASRQQGLGRTLLYHLIDQAKQQNVDIMFLEVRPSNVAALALYDALGFDQAGTRPDYYPTDFGGREDALILAKAI